MKKIMMFMVCLVALCFCKSVKANAQAMISSGYYHTAMIKNDGSLWMCGQNQSGQLGDGTRTIKSKPVKIMTDVKKVYCGHKNTAIIKKDNSLWVCGLNNYGQIGDGTTTNRYTPVKVMTGVKDASIGGYFTGALKNDGTVWTWGSNTDTKPIKVASDVASLSIGYSHSAIVKKDGSLWTWGYNEYGEIGNNTITACYAPQKIMTGVSSVSLRGWHTVVMKKNGSLQTWGYNRYGQLGDGTTTNRLVPTKEVFYFVKAQQISASSRTVSNKTKSFSLNAKTNGNGKLSYSSSNKGVVTVNSNGQVRVVNCGIAEITIKASATTGYFAATKKITIQVIPSKPSLRTVKSPAKKIITAKWKKDKTITGYQFYMSTNKSFKTGTLTREYKSNKTQFKIFGWKSKKTYYLKMRSYKKVGGKKIYSDWSSVRKVKVK